MPQEVGSFTIGVKKEIFLQFVKSILIKIFMRIGIICAIPNELRYFSFSENPIQKIGERKFYKGTHDKHELILVQSGLGKVNAAVVSTLLIEKFKCEFLLFSGVAGGIDPKSKLEK